jgi:integrase
MAPTGNSRHSEKQRDVERLSDVLEEMFERLPAPPQGRSSKTEKAYRDAVLRFARITGCSTVAELEKLTPRELQAKVDETLRSKTYAPATVALTLMVAKKLARYLVREERLPASPFRELEPVRVGNNVPEWNVLSPEEAEKVLESLPKRSLSRVVFTWLLRMGLRVDELLGLKYGDLTVEPSRWVIRFRGKGRHTYRMAVHHEARAALEAWWEEVKAEKGKVPSEPDDALIADLDGRPVPYPWVFHTVTSTTKRVVGHRVTPHGLRASFITRVAREKGLEAARKLARHTNVKMTWRYVRGDVVLDEEEL